MYYIKINILYHKNLYKLLSLYSFHKVLTIELLAN